MPMWLVSVVALLPPFFAAIVSAGRGSPGSRLVGIQLATSLAIIILIALSFTFDQASSIDLALCLAILTLPGTLLFALFYERWL